ncbi:MAG: acyl-CoA thioesterase [Cyclobacteriaceae bacterium]
MKSFECRTVQESMVTITELMIPSYANFGGKIHGGIILSMMDKAAYAAASKHSGAYCVTVSVDNVNFRQPVDVGDLVSLKASVNYVGRSSMVIGIRVEAENVKLGIVKHTNTSYFTMVAKDDNGNLIEVPKLKLETEKEVRRYASAILRKKMNIGFGKDYIESKKKFSLEEEIEKLKGERCKIEIQS